MSLAICGAWSGAVESGRGATRPLLVNTLWHTARQNQLGIVHHDQLFLREVGRLARGGDR